MFFSLENAGELRFIILRRKKGGEIPVTTHTTPLQNKSTNAPVETKRRPRLDVLQTTGLQGEGEAGKPRKIAPATAQSRLSSRAKPKTPPKLGVAP